MKRRRLKIAAAVATIGVGLMVVGSCSRSEPVLQIPLADGEVEIYYQRSGSPVFWFSGIGGLRYRVKGGFGQADGWLTTEATYDMVDDVDIGFEHLDPNTVKIVDKRYGPVWTISVGPHGADVLAVKGRPIE